MQWHVPKGTFLGCALGMKEGKGVLLYTEARAAQTEGPSFLTIDSVVNGTIPRDVGIVAWISGGSKPTSLAPTV
jgi:hypothetical protein